MPLDINDGYTLKASTLAEYKIGDMVYTDLPTVDFTYRPALPDAIYSYNLDYLRAATGQERTNAAAKLITEHVKSWDVKRRGESVPVTAETTRKIPLPILEQMVTIVLTWAPANQEAAAGNS